MLKLCTVAWRSPSIDAKVAQQTACVSCRYTLDQSGLKNFAASPAQTQPTSMEMAASTVQSRLQSAQQGSAGKPFNTTFCLAGHSCSWHQLRHLDTSEGALSKKLVHLSVCSLVCLWSHWKGGRPTCIVLSNRMLEIWARKLPSGVA